MERQAVRSWGQKAAIIAGTAVLLWLTRHVLWSLLVQLLGGYGLMALALPLCRVLEKRMPPGLAAALSLLVLGVGLLMLLVLLIPPLVQQFRQVSAMFPAWMSWLEARLSQGQAFLMARGVNLSSVRDELLGTVSRYAGNAVSTLAAGTAQLVRTLGKLVLSPLIAFYLLRDRRAISSLLMLLLPVSWRARAARAGREMRRETAGFLRGQLMVSALVGVLTAVGLLLIGTPGWLLLGL
ncbi:MAG: AI-2E family transporter, partial [Aristaeellaceae bacterium]